MNVFNYKYLFKYLYLVNSVFYGFYIKISNKSNVEFSRLHKK